MEQTTANQGERDLLSDVIAWISEQVTGPNRGIVFTLLASLIALWISLSWLKKRAEDRREQAEKAKTMTTRGDILAARERQQKAWEEETATKLKERAEKERIERLKKLEESLSQEVHSTVPESPFAQDGNPDRLAHWKSSRQPPCATRGG